MKLKQICLVSLGCVSGALAFGVVANAAIDLVLPSAPKQAAALQGPPAREPSAQPAKEPASQFVLASTNSVPVEAGPAKVKVIPIVVRDGQLTELIEESRSAPAPAVSAMPAPIKAVAIPLPRPRPASAPSSHEVSASLARQPGAMAIAAATRKANAEDGEMLSAAGVERMKMALALTAEQEEFWPAIASELRALGKAIKVTKGNAANINLDGDTMQRLYYAAAPLISRLSYEQKLKVKEMAHVMGLHQVAQAL